MKLRSWSIYLLLAASIGFTLMTGFIIYYGETEKTEDTRELLHTHEVIHSANQLYTTLLDAETGQRGYLLTGNDEYLKPYKDAINHVQGRLERLKKIADDKAEQELIINELQPAIESKLDELNQSITLLDEEGLEEAIKLTNTHAGRELMSQIRLSLDKLIENEEMLLAEQREELDQSYLLFNIISYGGVYFIGITIIFAITTIRRQNKENQKLINQLESSNEILSELHEREVQLSTEKSKFMSMAAHDLRSPLNAIISISDLLKNEQDDFTKEQQQYLSHISESGQKMAEMINSFLNVEKIEEGEHDMVHPEIVNVTDLLSTIIAGFQVKAESKDISLQFENRCQQNTFCTDRAILSQVAENLISNALKYSPPHTTVFVSLAEENEHDNCQLIVSDQGLGIKEDEIDRIFEPYPNISNEPTGDESSTGLGLSIVKNRIDTLGGTVQCDSTVGVGTTFTITFPQLDCKKSPA
ncbi:MAG: CHASE3 domain-containing protein [Bacteroidota bacterium]